MLEAGAPLQERDDKADSVLNDLNAYAVIEARECASFARFYEQLTMKNLL